ncbi:NTP transferase domain-containing protein [Paenibacillus sp. IB182496]|uniref:Glucose-1-phosphate thymidylyltransferase n=1 Tax=Paenibacillus sabuli TaxID=2772509 RepID=A0A927BZI8_9BACL|nr:sugar phosphate nucleotidyltransferase [Paenibacillus sabuli]MBD2848615.1 NTP transferase domain-containing protein [Paenibacillus sabuli]
MKGILLAGGTGSRLDPLTRVVNKHLLPVGQKPMICHNIVKLKEAGIEEIALVITPPSASLYAGLLGSGSEWGVRLTYYMQDKAGGIAQALQLTRPMVRSGEKFVVILGDNLFEDKLAPHAQAYEAQATGARVLLKQVEDARRYGVPELQGGHIVSIEEKPKRPKSNYCITGIYMYDASVYDIIGGIKPSARGELEITDVNNVYAARGELEYDVLKGWWTDAGTFRSLLEAGSRLMGGDER